MWKLRWKIKQFFVGKIKIFFVSVQMAERKQRGSWTLDPGDEFSYGEVFHRHCGRLLYVRNQNLLMWRQSRSEKIVVVYADGKGW